MKPSTGAFAACTLLPLLWFGAPSPALSDGFNARMSTVAGNGAPGFQDGDALSSTFTLPIGIALGADGSIYVSDAGAQRIRVIRNGRVRTLAGGGDFVRGGFWVRGAYKDGPPLDARFNFPAALAVDPRGNVYVADADNRCIREIAPDGTVSTYSGSPAKTSSVDGPRSSASFTRPMGVALNAQGDLYVADEGFGIRKIAADGAVTTVQVDPGVTGVTVSPDGRTVLGSNITGGMSPLFDGHGNPLPSANLLGPDSGPHLGNLADVGHPFAAAMIDDRRAIYTDAKTGAIRYVDLYLGANKFLAGDRGSDASNEASGFRDGPLGVARVFDPLGVAVTQNGVVFFADSGNRRIRSIATLNLREATITAIDALPPQMSDAGSNIVIVGNSYVWANCVWDDSWEGLLEARLRAAEKHVTLYPIMMVSGSAPVMFDYIKEVVAELPRVHQVIFLSNVGVVISSETGWRAPYVAGLRQVKETLEKAGISFDVAIEPTAYDFDWSELPVLRYLTGDSDAYVQSGDGTRPFHEGFLDVSVPERDSVSTAYEDLLRATKESGVAYSDLTPYFLMEFRRTEREPLFGTSEWHQSDQGRVVMADAMYHALADPPK
jgi:hypothetical protein